MKSIAVLVFDGFADWEPAFALTGLRRWGKREVITIDRKGSALQAKYEKKEQP